MGKLIALKGDVSRSEQVRLRCGRVFMEPDIESVFDDSFVYDSLLRHGSGHWGWIDELTRLQNQLALLTGEGRIVSLHRDAENRELRVATFLDFSVTVVMRKLVTQN